MTAKVAENGARLAIAQAFWLAWSQIPNVGAILIQRLQARFGSLEVAWYASSQDLMTVEGVGPQIAETIQKFRCNLDPIVFAEQHIQANPNFWTPDHPDYPRWLLEIPDPPPVLYYRGRVDLAENHGLTPAIAIVGTRRPSDYGRRWTRRLSSTLAQVGFTVVSGLADGIDTEAHQSCLAEAGRTIAVLGTGVDVVYPASNRQLSQQIAERGLLVSEFPAGTQPDRPHFPMRNRIIAGLCRATLVIEAPQKSGSLITARLANEYGREVYALPGTLDNPRAIGCLSLLNQGAQLILGEKELLDMLGTLPPLSPTSNQQLSLLDGPLLDSSRLDSPPPQELQEPQDLEPELHRVLQAVTLEPIAIDRIVQETGLSAAEVLSALSQLELMELVSLLPGMRYQRG